MNLDELNDLSFEKAFEAFQKCCGSSNWANSMNKARPFESQEALFDAAHFWWEECSFEDVMEAFQHHPKIGSVAELEKKFASTANWASGEQAAVKDANQAVLQALAAGNEAYEAKFGYIFIVCATGKSAEEMLNLLNQRLPNSPEIEIEIAKGEQMKITIIRLKKLLEA